MYPDLRMKNIPDTFHETSFVDLLAAEILDLFFSSSLSTLIRATLPETGDYI